MRWARSARPAGHRGTAGYAGTAAPPRLSRTSCFRPAGRSVGRAPGYCGSSGGSCRSARGPLLGSGGPVCSNSAAVGLGTADGHRPGALPRRVRVAEDRPRGQGQSPTPGDRHCGRVEGNRQVAVGVRLGRGDRLRDGLRGAQELRGRQLPGDVALVRAPAATRAGTPLRRSSPVRRAADIPGCRCARAAASRPCWSAIAARRRREVRA